jgi:hypothetical protein
MGDIVRTPREGVLRLVCMSNAAPKLPPSAPVLRSMSPQDALAFARQNERLAASVGQTVEEFAAGVEFRVSLEEAVRFGWITAADQRLFEGRATRAELEEIGFPPEEIAAILEEQRVQGSPELGSGCESSTMSSAAKERATKTDLDLERDEFPELADDPVWQACLNAPIGEPETPEQRRLAAEAMRGPSVPGSVVTAEIAERCRRGE